MRAQWKIVHCSKYPISWMREHLKDFDHMAEKLLASIADRLHGVQIEAEQLTTMSASQMVGVLSSETLCAV